MKKYVLFLVILFPSFQIFGGSTLPVPVNLQKAYENGTRSMDGRPGPAYWQNHSDYKIEVRFEPATRTIDGHEKIVYYNESPDSLDRLVIRLYQDIFKKGNARDWAASPEDLHDGVKIRLLKIDGQEIALDENPDVRRYGTNMRIRLQRKIAPKSSALLEVDWQLTISKKSNIRMGTYDSTSFHIAYWYPQIAVYDDLEGWDTFNYTGGQEFYNDFCNYDVKITVPKNFVVWATGRLQNMDEVLQKKFVKRYKKALSADEVIHVITEEDLQQGHITADNVWNTFIYKAQHVPDFAFSTSDHYLWDLTSAKVAENRERVLIGAAYKKGSEDFYEVAEVAKKAILFFSNEMPAYPFPYPSLTVFNGSGGMEFPMMVNDGSARERSGMVHVTSHEIAHTYFPFMMGTNERKYAWMDEGWATMLPFEFQAREAKGYDPIRRTITRYLRIAGSEYDVPMIYPATIYGGQGRFSYRNASYNRPGIAYYLLEEYLGRERFLKAMHEYIERWKGKHPMPFDFFFTFNDVLKEDLSWFFKPWFFEFGYPDLALQKVDEDEDNLLLKVVKKGKLPVPVKLIILYQDSSKAYLERSMAVWKTHLKEIEISVKKEKPVLEIWLGDEHVPDLFEKDNKLKIEE